MERVGEWGYRLTPEEWHAVSEDDRLLRLQEEVVVISVGNAGGMIERGEPHLMTFVPLSRGVQQEFEGICASVGVEVPPLNPNSDLQSTSPQTE